MLLVSGHLCAIASCMYMYSIVYYDEDLHMLQIVTCMFIPNRFHLSLSLSLPLPPLPPSLLILLAAPVAPVEVNVHDIGPTSVRLEWMFGDNGGAPITGIRVTFITLSKNSDFVDFNISSEQTSALVPGLKDNHQYRFSIQARNRIGNETHSS